MGKSQISQEEEFQMFYVETQPLSPDSAQGPLPQKSTKLKARGKKSNFPAEKPHTHCLKPGDQDSHQIQEIRHVDSAYLSFDAMRMALDLCDLLPRKA